MPFVVLDCYVTSDDRQCGNGATSLKVSSFVGREWMKSINSNTIDNDKEDECIDITVVRCRLARRTVERNVGDSSSDSHGGQNLKSIMSTLLLLSHECYKLRIPLKQQGELQTLFSPSGTKSDMVAIQVAKVTTSMPESTHSFRFD